MLDWKSLKKIKKRLLNIIDSQFQLLQQNYLKLIYQNQHIINSQRINHQKSDHQKQNISIGQYKINQAKLQDWILTLSNQLIQWQPNNMKKVHKILKSSKQDENKQNYQEETNKIKIPKMIQKKQPKFNMLFKANNDELTIYTIDQQNLSNSLYNLSKIFQKQTITFSPHTFNPNCSITYIHLTHSILLIGGSLSSNPNLKSNKILQYCIKSNKLQQFSSLSLSKNLPYGISSHAAVYNEKYQQIYIIGGNRDHSVVSRGCFKIRLKINKKIENSSRQQNYQLTNLQVTQIACLNYPCSSSTCIMSSSFKFIYKIGGIGQSFGQWGNSPYFQRYSIELNQWEVINPKISSNIQVNKISKYIFMANSLCYLGENVMNQEERVNDKREQEKIVIFGGYKINGEATNKAIVIKLQQNNNNQQQQDGDLQISEQTSENYNQKSQIIEFGQLNNKFIKKCGFNNNQVFSLRNVNNTQKSYIFSLATVLNEQKLWTQEPVFFQI